MKKDIVDLFEELLSLSYKGGPCNSSNKTKNHYECGILNILEESGFLPFKNLSGKRWGAKALEALFESEHPEWRLPVAQGQGKLRALAFADFKKNLKEGVLKLRNYYGKKYIWQPFGSQQHPDFYVIHGNIIVAIEAKSGRNKLQFNSGMPSDPNQVYMFAVKAGSGAVLGKHIFSSAFVAEIAALEEVINQLVEKSNERLQSLTASGKNRADFSYYNRRMLNHHAKLVGEDNKKSLQGVRDYLTGLYGV
jgi:hypothetical protein